MNIAFTKEELTKFASDLSEWYTKKTLFVCENFMRQRDQMRLEGDAENALQRISDYFDKHNPKPDWRGML